MHGRAVVRGAKRALVVVDMPFGSYEESPSVAFRNAAHIMKETGCGAIKLEGGRRMAETIRFLVERGIPVMAHIGLTPQSINVLGGFKTQGRVRDEWAAIEEDAKAVAEAGAFSIVLEAMAEELARKITAAIPIPTIGIGASAGCDGQILVMEDMLGLSPRVPKFVKEFGKVGEAIRGAISAYATEVRNRTFPAPEHTYAVKDDRRRPPRRRPKPARDSALPACGERVRVRGGSKRRRSLGRPSPQALSPLALGETSEDEPEAKRAAGERGNAMLQLVPALDRLGTETAFEVLARADALKRQGKDIINLGIGQPDFKTPAAHRRGRHQGAARRPSRLHAGARHPAAARGGGARPEAPPRRRGASRHHRHLAGRQADHVLRHPDVRPAGRRDHVSRPRLPDLPLHDRVHRRQAGADRAERGQRVQLHRRPGARRRSRPRPASSSSTARAIPAAARPARRRSRSWSKAWSGTPTSPSCPTRSTARCCTAGASTRASCAIPRSRIA